MDVRRANEADIPAIVGLLKESLGESLVPKSEAYWRWKHVQNPFGESPVLVAEEEGRLIGVRAFMQWRWVQDATEYKALRAVDTATHPKYLGKGIFSKLTAALVDQCKGDGFDFIFNTPNDKSKPGYLKLGWQVAGKLPVTFSPRVLSLMSGKRMVKEGYGVDGKYSISNSLNDPLLEKFLDELSLQKIHTAYSRTYLSWRYSQVPVATYGAVGHLSGDEKFLLIFRIKDRRWLRELRVVECLGNMSRSNRAAREKIHDLLSTFRPGAVTWSASLGSNLLLPALSVKGPVVTLRALNTIIPFENWSPTLGDMELF